MKTSCQIYHKSAIGAVPIGHTVLITDPPYSPYVHSNSHSSGSGGRGPKIRDYGFPCLKEELRNHIAFFASMSLTWSIIFSDHESTGLWNKAITKLSPDYIRTIPWIRWSQPQITSDRPPSGSEAVLHYHGLGMPLSWNGPGNLTHYNEKAMRGDEKYSAQKPLGLMMTLVSYYSNEHDLIFDPCCGWGTTGLACKALNRKFVGYDQDSLCVAIAQKRLATFSANDLESVAKWCRDSNLRNPITKTFSEVAIKRDVRRNSDVEIARDFLRKNI